MLNGVVGYEQAAYGNPSSHQCGHRTSCCTYKRGPCKRGGNQSHVEPYPYPAIKGSVTSSSYINSAAETGDMRHIHACRHLDPPERLHERTIHKSPHMRSPNALATNFPFPSNMPSATSSHYIPLKPAPEHSPQPTPSASPHSAPSTWQYRSRQHPPSDCRPARASWSHPRCYRPRSKSPDRR